MAGRVPLDELSERLDVDFGVEDVTTVGGLVYALFGRVPRAGESLVNSGFRIVVERVRRRRIERVYFERVQPRRRAGATNELPQPSADHRPDRRRVAHRRRHGGALGEPHLAAPLGRAAVAAARRAAVTYLERPHRMLTAANVGVALTLLVAGMLIGMTEHGLGVVWELARVRRVRRRDRTAHSARHRATMARQRSPRWRSRCFGSPIC